MTTKKSEWETVGKIGVDAGMVIVGDPCYFATPDAESHPADTWDEFCKLISDTDTTQLGDFLGVVVTSGYGDGIYPVEIRRNKEGRIAELRVRFIQED